MSPSLFWRLVNTLRRWVEDWRASGGEELRSPRINTQIRDLTAPPIIIPLELRRRHRRGRMSP